MDDYYDLLGVAPDSSPDEIRTAYRDRLDKAQGADKGHLHRAWNVLADPYQRGRYDERLATAKADGLDEGDGGEGAPSRAPAARRRGLFGALAEPSGGSGGRRPPAARPQPTIKLPPGVEFAPTGRRVRAFAFDLAILILVFFLGNLLVTGPLKQDLTPKDQDRLEALQDSAPPQTTSTSSSTSTTAELPASTTTTLPSTPTSAAESTTSSSEPTSSTKRKKSSKGLIEQTEDEKTDLDDQIAAAKKDKDEDLEKKLEKQKDKVQDTLTKYQEEETTLVAKQFPLGIQLGVFVAVAVLAVAYLVVPSLAGGQTVGKRFQGIRVVLIDGDPATPRALLIRYGLPVTLATVLNPLLLGFGQIAALMIVLLWLGNPNKQGVHDRLAKTIVVADEGA